jgi:hypothetical protein
MGDYEVDTATVEELAAMPSEEATDAEIPEQTSEVLEGEDGDR